MRQSPVLVRTMRLKHFSRDSEEVACRLVCQQTASVVRTYEHPVRQRVKNATAGRGIPSHSRFPHDRLTARTSLSVRLSSKNRILADSAIFLSIGVRRGAVRTSIAVIRASARSRLEWHRVRLHGRKTPTKVGWPRYRRDVSYAAESGTKASLASWLDSGNRIGPGRPQCQHLRPLVDDEGGWVSARRTAGLGLAGYASKQRLSGRAPSVAGDSRE